MADFCKVIILGRLTRDPDFRSTASGMAVCGLGIAVNHPRKDDGTYFGEVVVFGKTAEACRQYLAKGSQVLVEGRLQNDEWQDKQTGQRRSKTQIIAENVQFVGRPGNASPDASRGQNAGYSAPAPAPAPPQGYAGGFGVPYSPPPMPEAPPPAPELPF